MITARTKFETVLAIIRGGMTPEQAAHRMDVDVVEVDGWVQDFYQRGEQFFEDASPSRMVLTETLYEISGLCTSVLNIHLLLRVVSERLIDKLGYDRVRVYMADAMLGEPVLRFDSADEAALDSFDLQPFDDGDLYLTPTRMALPMTSGDRVMGVVSIMAGRPFSPYEQRLLPQFADQLAIAFENSMLFAEIQNRVSELVTINTIGQMIHEALTPDALYDIVQNVMDRTLGAEGFLVLTTPDGLFVPVYTAEGGLKEVERAFVEDVLSTGQTFTSETQAVIPVLFGDTLYGVVGTSFPPEEQHTFTRILTSFARMVGAQLYSVTR